MSRSERLGRGTCQPLAAGVVGLVQLLAAACSEPPPTAKTIDGAFLRVASAIDAGDAKRLYWDLDLETRWSLMSIHRSQKQIRRLVEGTYPPEERARAAGRWSFGSEAQGPGELFALHCAHDDCLGPLRARIGALERTEETAEGVVVHTARGGTYRFKKGGDGRWGLLGFGEEFARLELEVARDLEVITQSATLYRDARQREER